jgi:CRISPR-associated protein Cmr4
MQTKILTIFTRTPLHVGAGSSVGAIDQPVIRERHTGFPVIPGSAIKGVLADLWLDELERDHEGKIKTTCARPQKSNVRKLFGSDDANAAAAGALLIGEAKVLAFPVRSAKGCFAWLVCPLTLKRFFRDTGKTIVAIPPFKNEGVLLGADTGLVFPEKKAIFEEYPLAAGTGAIPTEIISALKPAVADAVWQELSAHLAIISDELFSYFAVNACEIAQHIAINDNTGVVKKGVLFNQENVPSETLFYAPVNAKSADILDQLTDRLNANKNLLQLGGDATTGLGWCSVKLA